MDKPIKLKPTLIPNEHKAELDIYENKGEWRWRITSYYNKKIVDAATEGFSSKQNCIENLKTVFEVLKKEIPKL